MNKGQFLNIQQFTAIITALKNQWHYDVSHVEKLEVVYGNESIEPYNTSFLVDSLISELCYLVGSDEENVKTEIQRYMYDLNFGEVKGGEYSSAEDLFDKLVPIAFNNEVEKELLFYKKKFDKEKKQLHDQDRKNRLEAFLDFSGKNFKESLNNMYPKDKTDAEYLWPPKSEEAITRNVEYIPTQIYFPFSIYPSKPPSDINSWIIKRPCKLKSGISRDCLVEFDFSEIRKIYPELVEDYHKKKALADLLAKTIYRIKTTVKKHTEEESVFKPKLRGILGTVGAKEINNREDILSLIDKVRRWDKHWSDNMKLHPSQRTPVEELGEFIDSISKKYIIKKREE
jgi:hypothetical protein